VRAWERPGEENGTQAAGPPASTVVYFSGRLQQRGGGEIMAGWRGLFNNLIATSLSYLPAETAQHLVNSEKELLLAVRALLDEQLKWSDIHLARAAEKRESRQARSSEAQPLDTVP